MKNVSFEKASVVATGRTKGRAAGLPAIEQFLAEYKTNSNITAIDVTALLVRNVEERDLDKIYNNLAHACRTYNASHQSNPFYVKVRKGVKAGTDQRVVQLYIDMKSKLISQAGTQNK